MTLIDEPIDPPAKILKVNEVADVLTKRTGKYFGEEAVRKLIRRKELPVRYLGRHLFVPATLLERFIADLLAESIEDDDGAQRDRPPLSPPIAPLAQQRKVI